MCPTLVSSGSDAGVGLGLVYLGFILAILVKVFFKFMENLSDDQED